MLVKFWGVHGSLPRPGPTTLKYGGNTACVEVRCGRTLIIFDAGTGIRELSEDILRRRVETGEDGSALTAHIFFSHLHWDHVQGFPFFAPIFEKGNKFHLYGGRGLNLTLNRLLNDQMSHPNFPVTLCDLAASLTFHDLESGDHVIVDDAVIVARHLNHPGGSFGYRLERNGKSLIYASDTEHDGGLDPRLLELALNADVLIHDSMFTPGQYLGLRDGVSRKSWGHSTWEGAVEAALAVKAKRLVLFHHGNDDDTVSEIESRAREKFANTTAAYEGLEIEL